MFCHSSSCKIHCRVKIEPAKGKTGLKPKQFQMQYLTTWSDSPDQPIRKAQSRKRSPSSFAHLVNFSKICLPSLIIIQSCYFDCEVNKPFTCSCRVICFSLLCSSLLCSRDLDVLRAQKMMVFYFNYPEINEVWKSEEHILTVTLSSFLVFLISYIWKGNMTVAGLNALHTLVIFYRTSSVQWGAALKYQTDWTEAAVRPVRIFLLLFG